MDQRLVRFTCFVGQAASGKTTKLIEVCAKQLRRDKSVLFVTLDSTVDAITRLLPADLRESRRLSIFSPPPDSVASINLIDSRLSGSGQKFDVLVVDYANLIRLTYPAINTLAILGYRRNVEVFTAMNLPVE